MRRVTDKRNEAKEKKEQRMFIYKSPDKLLDGLRFFFKLRLTIKPKIRVTGLIFCVKAYV